MWPGPALALFKIPAARKGESGLNFAAAVFLDTNLSDE